MIAMSVVFTELRQSWRGLFRRPAFLLLATFTLALGVATVTAMFALLDQALLKPLPFPHAERLVTLGTMMGEDRNAAGIALYRPLKAMPLLESAGIAMAGVQSENVVLDGRPHVVAALKADRGFLETLGLPMAVGRNFNEAESLPHGPGAVLLSYGFWKTRFGGDPTAVGRLLEVEGKGMQIVGVLPAAFRWPDAIDLVVAMQPDPASDDMNENQLVLGRMRPDATVAGVSAATASIATPLLLASVIDPEKARQRLAQEPPRAIPIMRSVFVGNSGRTIWLFLGAAACVMLIGIINLASLILMRSLSRTHAYAVRAALGSSTGRLSLPALGEGLLVGLLGAACGLLLAWIGLRLVGGFVPPEWTRGEPVTLTGMSVAFATMAGLVAAAGATVLAVLRGRRRDWRGELVGGGRGGISREDGRVGRWLVVAQVAVAVVLLVGAALFTRTLYELESVPMGFSTRNVTTFALSPVKQRYVTATDVTSLTHDVLERLRRLPEVESAGESTTLPTADQLNWPVVLPNGGMVSVQYRITSPGFLETVGIPLLAGRMIAATDVAGADPVCVVSTSFARRYFGASSPLGRIVTLHIGGENNVAMRVVGVVGDVRQYGPAKPAPPVFYTPRMQMPPEVWSFLRQFGGFSFAVRLHPGTVLGEATLRDAVNQAAPGQPISDVQSLESVVASTTTEQRLNLLLVGLFAGMALVLACVGLYAVMSVAVTAHRHDYGVRAALGATRNRLLMTVIRSAAVQVGLGLAIGLATAMALSRLLAGFLFGIDALDPLAIGAVLLTLGLSGLLASLPPAWRAARVRPMQALRVD